MKRGLLFLLLLLFFGCKTEEEAPVAREQEEFVIASPNEVPQPPQKQIAKPRRRVAATPTPSLPEPSAEIVEHDTPKDIPKQEQKEEPNEEIQTALNRTVFEESFGWRAMNAVPMPAPIKHPDSLKWEDISGGPIYYSETPWWIKALAYINTAAALLWVGYLLITNK